MKIFGWPKYFYVRKVHICYQYTHSQRLHTLSIDMIYVDEKLHLDLFNSLCSTSRGVTYKYTPTVSDEQVLPASLSFPFHPLNLFHKKYSLSRHLSNTFLNSLRILSPTTDTPPVLWLNRNRYQHGLSISILQFL